MWSVVSNSLWVIGLAFSWRSGRGSLCGLRSWRKDTCHSLNQPQSMSWPWTWAFCCSSPEGPLPRTRPWARAVWAGLGIWVLGHAIVTARSRKEPPRCVRAGPDVRLLVIALLVAPVVLLGVARLSGLIERVHHLDLDRLRVSAGWWLAIGASLKRLLHRGRGSTQQLIGIGTTILIATITIAYVYLSRSRTHEHDRHRAENGTTGSALRAVPAGTKGFWHWC